MKRVEPTLKVGDLHETIDFYRDLLGFQLDLLWPAESPNFCIMSHDDVRLMFYVDTEHREPQPQMTGQLRLDIVGVTPLYESLRDKVDTEWGPEVFHYGRREVAIVDCNGYSIILSEITSDPPTCDVD